jgi:hypothetical protein
MMGKLYMAGRTRHLNLYALSSFNAVEMMVKMANAGDVDHDSLGCRKVMRLTCTCNKYVIFFLSRSQISVG